MTFETFAAVSLGLLGVAAALAVARAVRAPSLADRIVALDLFVVVAVLVIAIESALDQSGVFLDDILVVSLLGFVATTSVARFIERRGAR